MRWLQYRSAVCSDVVDEKTSYPMASKPANTKGTAGWTRRNSKKIDNGNH